MWTSGLCGPSGEVGGVKSGVNKICKYPALTFFFEKVR